MLRRIQARIGKTSVHGVVLTALLLLAGTVVAGCGSSGNEGSASNTASKSATKDAPFVWAVPAVPSTLDTHPYGGDATRALYFTLDSHLLSYKASGLKDNGCEQLAGLSDVAPNLATSWTVSPDRKSITLKLGDAKSAYGNTLTAADVVWSFQRAVAVTPNIIPQITQISHWDTKDLVTSSDPKTVTIHITKATPFDVATLPHFLLQVWDSTEVKKHATKADPWAEKWLTTHTADFGPWQLDSFQPGDQVTFKPNPNYTGSRGNIGRLTIKAIPDASTRLQVLKSGDADWASQLSYDQSNSLKGAAGVTVKQCLSPNRDELVLQQKDPKFADVRVRQAISMALDRDALVKGAYFGFGKPAIGGVSQYYSLPTTPEGYQPQNVEQSKKLLAEAGYPSGFDMVLTYSPSRPGPQAAPAAVLLKDMLSKVGIRVKLRPMTQPTDFFTAFLEGNYQSALWSEQPILADGAYSTLSFNDPRSASNSFHFKSAEYSKTLDKAQALPDGEERGKVVAELGTLGVTQVPVVYLVDQAYVNSFRSGITGYQGLPDGNLRPHTLTKP